MVNIGTDDPVTVTLETPTLVSPAVQDVGNPPPPQAMPWYDRRPVLLAAGFLGIVGLLVLAVSVVSVSDQSTRPPQPTTTVSTPSIPTRQAPEPAAPPVDNSLAPTPFPPPQPPTSATDDAPPPDTGPIAETIDPMPPQPAPGHYRRWLHRNFPGFFGAPG